MNKQLGFSGIFLLVVIAIGIFLAGASESLQTPNPTQVIPDPNSTFANPTGKESLQLKTIGFVTVSPPSTPQPAALCQNTKVNTEPGIIVGYDPKDAGTVGSGGQVKIWIADENPPCIGTGTVADPTTGLITTPGDTTTKASDGYLWAPALYVSQFAENGGIPHFPTMIKGIYNNGQKAASSCSEHSYGDDSNQETLKTNILHGPAVDPFPAGVSVQNPSHDNNIAEYVWNVNDLGLQPGTYPAEFVIWDGDRDRGIGCINITMQ